MSINQQLPGQPWDDYIKQIMATQIIPSVYSSTSTNINPMATSKDAAYINLMLKINILLTGKAIEPREAVRLVSMLDSADTENWMVAVECIKQKLSEL